MKNLNDILYDKLYIRIDREAILYKKNTNSFELFLIETDRFSN